MGIEYVYDAIVVIADWSIEMVKRGLRKQASHSYEQARPPTRGSKPSRHVLHHVSFFLYSPITRRRLFFEYSPVNAHNARYAHHNRLFLSMCDCIALPKMWKKITFKIEKRKEIKFGRLIFMAVKKYLPILLSIITYWTIIFISLDLWPRCKNIIEDIKFYTKSLFQNGRRNRVRMPACIAPRFSNIVVEPPFHPFFATYCYRHEMTRILGIFHTRYDPPNRSSHPCKIFKLQKGYCPSWVTYLLTHQFVRAIVQPPRFSSIFLVAFMHVHTHVCLISKLSARIYVLNILNKPI